MCVHSRPFAVENRVCMPSRTPNPLKMTIWGPFRSPLRPSRPPIRGFFTTDPDSKRSGRMDTNCGFPDLGPPTSDLGNPLLRVRLISPHFAFFAHFVVLSPFSPFPAPLRAIFSPKRSFWRHFCPFSAPDPLPDASGPPESRFGLPLAPFSANIVPPAKTLCARRRPGELRGSGIVIYRTDPFWGQGEAFFVHFVYGHKKRTGPKSRPSAYPVRRLFGLFCLFVFKFLY